MDSPFQNPDDCNPFQPPPPIQYVPAYIPPVAPQVVFVEHVVVKKDKNLLLEIPGICCLSYFCGPCYMFFHLCCMVCR
jgi:hypothetical protein